MNKQIFCLLLILIVSLRNTNSAQNVVESDTSKTVDLLFDEQQPLKLKLNYSNKDLKKNTNDSTYVKSELSYLNNNSEWTSLNIELRARGNFRKANCYFVPIKISIKKKDYKGTIFKGHKKLKLVVPCLLERDKDDNVIKEYIAYKLYELMSPLHFGTRLVDIELTEPRGKREKIHSIKGFLIEDDKKVAKPFDGKIMNRSIHPQAQEEMSSIRTELFQFMIGNTDFSNMEQHNCKLIYIDSEIHPVPYDFDMSGLVNTSYSVVSGALAQKMNIGSVTQRVYRGFKRNPASIEKVRQEFIKNKPEVFKMIDSLKSQFESESEFETAREYIQDFYNIIMNDNEYESKIIRNLRGQ